MVKRIRPRKILTVFIWSVIPAAAFVTVAAYFGMAIDRHVYPPVVPVMGRSMNPLLHFGDLVMLKRADVAHLKVGDIIAFRTTSDIQQKWNVPGSYVHRIVAVETGAYGQQFQTKGDNVPGKDPFWTVEQNVVGIYTGKISGAGFPILFFRSQQGKILVGSTLFIFFLYWLLGIFERRRSAAEVNVNNLASIVDEARRITQRLDQILPEGPPPILEKSIIRADPSDPVTNENQKTLNQLVGAIGEYGQHLQSHTAVMKNLASTTAELQGATVKMREAVTLNPQIQSTPVAQMPELKRKGKGYSRKAVRSLYKKMSSDLFHKQQTIESLESDLIESQQIQTSLASSLAITQELLRDARSKSNQRFR